MSWLIGSGFVVAGLLLLLLVGLIVDQLIRWRRADPLPAIVERPTKRLVLRRQQAADLEAFERSIDDRFMTNNGWTPRHRLAALRGAGARSGLGRRGRVVAVETATGQPVVFLMVARAPDRGGRWEIGIHTTPAKRGRGYGREALIALVTVLDRVGTGPVYIGTAVDNTIMQRVILDSGATEDERGPHSRPNGSVVDSIWYRYDIPAR